MKRSTALGLLTAAASTPFGPRLLRAQELTTIRMATINIDSGGEPFYAEQAGFFKEQGLHATFQTFNNGQAIAAAVLGGALDIAVSNPVALAQAHAHHVPFVIVASSALYLAEAPTTEMMVPKDSTIAGPKDLDGKTVAANGINGIPQYCIEAWVDQAGGAAGSVKFVEMNFAQMMDALGTQRVDAACVTEPFITEAKRTGRSIGLPFNACAKRFLMSTFVSSKSWADAHPDVIKRFQTGLYKAAAWANKNHDKTAPLLMEFTHLPESTVQTMRRAYFAESWNPADAQPLVDLTARYSGIPSFPIADMFFRATA